MSRVVWKYEIGHARTEVDLPKDAECVRVSPDPRGVACMWALVDPDAPTERVQLEIYGTGHPIPDGRTFIGSWLDGPFVWHLFASPAT